MDIEKYFEIMSKINQEEHDYISNFPEGLNNLSHEDTMGEFYEKKNNIAEAFIKECAILSPQELEEIFKKHSVSYIMQTKNGHVINDRMTISLNGENYFTIFPSRIQDSEALTKFVQNCISENSPIISGERTIDEIAGAYHLRKQVTAVKSKIGKNVQYCSDYDIADYIKECCDARSEDDVNISHEAEIMLSVLQKVHLSDQGVSMPSDVQVANIISSYERGEINLENMIFELTNVTGLYHELHTTEEVMEAFGVSEEEAEKMFEEEGFEDYNEFDTVSYNEDPYTTYLIIKNGTDIVTDGFVTEEELTEEQKRELDSISKSTEKEEHSIGEIEDAVSDRKSEDINKVISEISEEMKDKSKENEQTKGN